MRGEALGGGCSARFLRPSAGLAGPRLLGRRADSISDQSSGASGSVGRESVLATELLAPGFALEPRFRRPRRERCSASRASATSAAESEAIVGPDREQAVDDRDQPGERPGRTSLIGT